MTPSNRAVRKASGERLIREFREAARRIAWVGNFSDPKELALTIASVESSRSAYACLMTAFGL